jgi:hypothetical protein
VFLCGCGTWYLTLREERSLECWGNMLRRIFGLKGDEVTSSRKLNTKELRSLYTVSKAVSLHAMEALEGRGGIIPTHSRPRY